MLTLQHLLVNLDLLSYWVMEFTNPFADVWFKLLTVNEFGGVGAEPSGYILFFVFMRKTLSVMSCFILLCKDDPQHTEGM